jgi:hypothetical protein
MKVLVCGSRHWGDREAIEVMLKWLEDIGYTTVIHGCCGGADTLAGEIALELRMRVEEYPAQWETHGIAAGPIRNKRMLEKGKPSLVLAFHDDIADSKGGTKDMIGRTFDANVDFVVITSAKIEEAGLVGMIRNLPSYSDEYPS